MPLFANIRCHRLPPCGRHSPLAAMHVGEVLPDHLETRNPKPETRNPKPQTRNPKPQTRNPTPETFNANRQTPNQPQIRNPTGCINRMHPRIRIRQHRFRASNININRYSTFIYQYFPPSPTKSVISTGIGPIFEFIREVSHRTIMGN